MMCDKVVCERECVTKVGCGGGGGGGGGRDGYRIKNKNPTQRCGGKTLEQPCTYEHAMVSGVTPGMMKQQPLSDT